MCDVLDAIEKKGYDTGFDSGYDTGFDEGEVSKARIRKGLVSHNWIYKYSNSPHVPKHAVEEMMRSARCTTQRVVLQDLRTVVLQP